MFIANEHEVTNLKVALRLQPLFFDVVEAASILSSIAARISLLEVVPLSRNGGIRPLGKYIGRQRRIQVFWYGTIPSQVHFAELLHESFYRQNVGLH